MGGDLCSRCAPAPVLLLYHTRPSLPPTTPFALAHGNRCYSSAAFQIATGHGFFADCSDTFRAHADDNTACPCGEALYIRPVRHSLQHVLFWCPLHSTPRARHLGGYSSLRALLSSEDGGHRLVKFLHYTQALLRPLLDQTHLEPEVSRLLLSGQCRRTRILISYFGSFPTHTSYILICAITLQ